MRRRRSWWLLVFLLIGLSSLGNLAGELLGQHVPALARAVGFSLGPAGLDLYVFGFTLGASARLNLGGFIGALAGILLYRRF